jgi:hypothetical protein
MPEAGVGGVPSGFSALRQRAEFPETIQVNTEPGTNGVQLSSAVRLATVTRVISARALRVTAPSDQQDDLRLGSG